MLALFYFGVLWNHFGTYNFCNNIGNKNLERSGTTRSKSSVTYRCQRLEEQPFFIRQGVQDLIVALHYSQHALEHIQYCFTLQEYLST